MQDTDATSRHVILVKTRIQKSKIKWFIYKSQGSLLKPMYDAGHDTPDRELLMIAKHDGCKCRVFRV